MEYPQHEKVEILSVVGDHEKSWSVDRYKLTVVVSIVSVLAITGGIIWLAAGGVDNASGANPLPTGDLKFGSKGVQGASTQQQELPYPSVKKAQALIEDEPEPTTKTPTKTPTPTPNNNSSTPTSTPVPTATKAPDPTNTPVPTESVSPAPITELKIEDIKVGEGPGVKNGDTIRINYIGTLTNGTKFDSSYDRGTPFETKIGVGQVIEGWDKGVIGMKVGGKRTLSIPSDMAYGATAKPGIPANSALIFEMELVEIK